MRNTPSADGALDAASVYRSLEAFEQAGVVRHVHLGHGPALYALVGEGEREYLYCDRCGSALAVAPQQLDEVRELVAARFGYGARFTHFPIVGLCHCVRAARARASCESFAIDRRWVLALARARLFGCARSGGFGVA